MTILDEVGVLEPDLEVRMSKMARFPNLFGHLYGKVDDQGMFRVIEEHLVGSTSTCRPWDSASNRRCDEWPSRAARGNLLSLMRWNRVMSTWWKPHVPGRS
ncbi:MAG: hypothetical protein KatS3mg082_1531 [Nitrospiraceae bacterium]|nr:MAG: hypothetical protein KatS3mg082_1531 [Nitrospiraceae bacterium]